MGAALRLLNLGGLQLYGELVDLMGTMPDMSRPKALALADRVAARGRETQLDLLIWLTDLALARLARTGVTGAPPARAAHPEEPRLLARLAPDPRAGRAWAEIAQSAGDRARHGRAVNIDAAALIFDMVSRIRDTAADVAA